MKKLLTTFAAFTALTAAATAADLPRRAAPPIFTPVPVFTWTGFYAGFNAGYGFGVGNDVGNTIIAAGPTTGIFGTSAGTLDSGVLAFRNGSTTEGFVGGGQIGYNYQFTPGSGVVVGVEADAQYVDFGRTRNNFAFATTSGTGGIIPGTLVYNPSGLSGLDYFGTVRGRIGYAFDRVLFYGTGGFAYGSGGGRQFGTGVNSDDFQTGYAAGGGIEYALPTDSFLNFFRSSAVTFKVEGLYVNLDRGSNNNAGAFATNINGRTVAVGDADVLLLAGATNRRQDTEFAVVRAGINYKFGSY